MQHLWKTGVGWKGHQLDTSLSTHWLLTADAMLCYTLQLCYAMLHPTAMLCYAMLCYAMLRYTRWLFYGKGYTLCLTTQAECICMPALPPYAKQS